MIRRVHFQKAIIAGAVGALAWELAARVSVVIGARPFDIVFMLGTLIVPRAEPLIWWPIGMAIHAGTGAVWCIFYAYFFWATFRWHPSLQGLAFSILPAVLAGLFMVPQLAHMHPLVLAGEIEDPGIFAFRTGAFASVAIFLGHAIYGLVIGKIYVRPVGTRTTRGAFAHA
jgi:hypothetical protein